MGARFVAKCHVAPSFSASSSSHHRAEFACVLCDKSFRGRRRDGSGLCGSVESLVTHLGREHGAEEFERDGDFVRMDDYHHHGGKKMVVRAKGGREMALA